MIAAIFKRSATETSPFSLRENFVWTWFGNGIYFAAQWGLLMVLAKFCDVDTVGQYSLALAIVGPIIVFSQMQLRQVAVTDAQNRFRYEDYFRCRSICTVAALVVVTLVIYILGYTGKVFTLMLLITIAKCFESLSDILYGKMQKYDRMDYIAKSMIIKGLFTLAAFWAALAFTSNILWACAGMCLIWAAIYLFYDKTTAKMFPSDQKPEHHNSVATFKQLIWVAMPLSLNSVLATVSTYLPRYFLEYYNTEVEVGLFAVASAPLLFISLFHNSIGQAVMSQAARYYQNRDFKSFKLLCLKISVIFLLIGAFFTSIFYFWGAEVMTLLFSEKYIKTVPILTIMSLGITLNGLCVFGFMVVVAGRMFRLQLLSIIVSIALQVPLSYYLIRNYGLLGAGWAEFFKTLTGVLFYITAGFLVHDSGRRKSDGHDNPQNE